MALLFDKTQNRVVDVADNLVNEALSSGNYEFRQGVRVPVVAPNGEEGTVLSDELGDLIPKGFRYLTQKEGRERAKGQIEEIREEEFGDRTGRALGLGALRGATLGLSDAGLRLAGEATGLEVDQALLETKRRNETASLIGEIGGGVGSFLVPGAGLGAVGRTVGALGAPTRAATELGMRAAQAIPGVTGATRAGRLARAPAAGAVEGAAIGVGQTISEAAMADPELTAEKALANVGLGAVFGGTLSALGRGGLEAADIGTKTALKKLSESEKIPKTAKEFAGSLSEIYGKALGLKVDLDIDSEGRTIFDAGSDGLRKRLVENVESPEKLYRSIESRFNVVRDFVDNLKKDSGSAAKIQKEILDEDLGNQIENRYKKLSGKNLAEAEKGYKSNEFLAARDKIFELANVVNSVGSKMKNDNKKFIGVFDPSAVKNLAVIKNNLKNVANNATKYSELSDALVRAKTDIAESVSVFEKRMDFLKTNNRVQYNTINKVRPLYFKLKEASTDEKIFGKLGSALADRAENLSELAQATQDFDKLFFDYVKKGGSFERVADYQKITRFFTNVDAPSKEKQRRALSQFNDSVDEVIKKLKPIDEKQLDDNLKKLEKAKKEAVGEENIEYINGKISTLTKQKEQLIEFNKKMAQTVESAKSKKAEFDEAIKIAKEDRAALLWLDSKELRTGKILQSLILGGLGGFGAGSAVDPISPQSGAFLGALGGAILANPRYALKVIYGLENAAVGLDRAARKSAVRFRNVSKKLEAQKGVFKGATVAGRQALIRANLKLDSDDRSENDEQAFQKHKERLDELASDPVGLYETLFDSMGENAATEVPISTQAMFETTARGVAFLQEKIPRDPFANPVMPDRYTPSFAEMDKYSRYVQAVKNPRQIFRELESGILRPETVEAVKNVYPGVYQSVVEAVATELMGENEIPYSARVQLSTLLNIPAVKSLTPEYVQTVIESERQGQEQPRQRTSPQAGQMTQSQIVSFRDVNVSGREQES